MFFQLHLRHLLARYPGRNVCVRYPVLDDRLLRLSRQPHHGSRLSARLLQAQDNVVISGTTINTTKAVI